MANTRKPREVREIIAGNVQKQYEKLFSKPDEPPALSMREVEALKTRIALLETELEQNRTKQPGASLSPESIQTSLKAPSVMAEASTAKKQALEPKLQVAELQTQLAKRSGLGEANFSPEQAGTRQFIIFVSLIGFFATTILTVVAILGGDTSQIVINAIGAISLAVTLVLAWLGFIGFGRVVIPFIALLSIGSTAATATGLHDPSVLAFAIVIATASLLMGQRGLILYGVLTGVTILGINYAGTLGILPVMPVALPEMIKTLIAIAATTLVSFLGTRRLEQSLQETRRNELTQIQVNRELEKIRINLADRTHDLELSSEVGRAITEKVANLSKMLSDATDLIRARFDFYYTQIYLLDPSGRNLILQAGTGNAGLELLRRGHHLPVSSGSLNGRAAAERRAVIVEDTQKNANFLPNPLLPLTRSEMAIPLIANGKVVGVLDMQSERPDTFSEANLAAFEVMAGQLAIAIQNAALFEQAEESRLEMEGQARRFTATGWQEFMNGVERSENMGFVYSQHEILPLVETQAAPSENGLVVPINISGTSVGEIRLDDEANRIWSASETEIVEATVAQVARQIENLRLLAQSERYRVVAEQASSRLTREGWSEYLQTRDELASGYIYDQNKVEPLNGNGHKLTHPGLSHPLVVRDETIGEMIVSTRDDADTTAAELIAAVAEQLSDRIENLRLLEQTEQQRADADKLYLIGQKISAAKDRQEIIAAVAENLDFSQINRGILLSYEYGESGEIENVSINANWYSGKGTQPTPLGRRFSTKVFTLANNFNGHDPAFVANTHTDPRVDPATREVFEKQNIRAFIALPIWDDQRQTGSLLLQSEDIIPFTGKELLPYTSIMQQLESALENQDLLQQTTQGEARMRTLIENAPEAIVVVDLTTGFFTEPNENAVRLYGLSREELLKVGPAQMSPPTQPDGRSSTEAAMEQIGKAMDGATPVFEWIHRNGQGQDIPCEIRLVRLPGEKPLVRASVTDITERKKAQETIARRATELQTVATLSTTASTVLDPDKLLQAVVDLTKERFGIYHAHIYLANEAWNSLLLAAGAGEIGRKMVAEEHNIPMDAERSLVARAARERSAIIVNDVRSDPGFLPNPLLPETRSEMAVPMIVGDNVLGVFDIQSVKANHFSEEDANIYTTLAAQVSVALQNARLYVEQAATVTQLRELDRLKSSFLANMSHELRTPLNSILGFADVMLEELDGPLTENMNNDLGLIQKNGQHLLHLINDVLDMAKIEAGRMNLNPEKFKVHEILDEVTSITSTMASEKNLALFIEKKSDQDLEIYADRTRLRQVMINLVNNSIKFTDKGKIAICVSPLEGSKVLITVKDTGIGIPPEKLESVFQEFIQVDTTSTRKVGGTGLGLPISRKLVEMHGGRLWAESTGVDGEGTTFFVELPLEAMIVEVVEKQEM